MSLIIGCPVKNDLNCMRAMMISLFDSTQSFDKLVFVDGGSTDGTIEYLTYVSKVDPRVQLITLNSKTPLEAYNFLFNMAETAGSDLLLTQTDVIYFRLYNRDWLKEMQLIVRNEEIGAVTTLNGGGVSGSDYIDGFRWLGGWCTYLPFRTLKLGGYDDSFPEGKYGVDIDHTYRILKSGLKIFYHNYFVDHHMANSREHDNHPDTEKHKQECAKYFRQKFKLGEYKQNSFGGGIEGI